MSKQPPSGDPLALKVLPAPIQSFVAHRHTLVSQATRITGCKLQAEDVVQEAFFRLDSKTLEQLGVKAQLGYMFRVVRNLAIDCYRKQRSESRHKAPDEACTEVENLPALTSPENQHQDQQTLRVIASALSELPERTRYAFEMYRLQGRSQREIAQELGVSAPLVNQWIREALLHCRQRVAAAHEPASLDAMS